MPNRVSSAATNSTTAIESSSGRLPRSWVEAFRESARSSMPRIVTTTALTSSNVVVFVTSMRTLRSHEYLGRSRVAQEGGGTGGQSVRAGLEQHDQVVDGGHRQADLVTQH